ncbi:hypothetical protein TRFO_35941 [Tritrichomonas foetus]|uniref:Uncharacterized protein n=1 Tax=Tritrichomonas foetus TaxID=1144522 RepID=A0A1J4JEZ7_9EUKA|nr:hypothetical protein TRFO_35941 [Tritrichomonas foetus]|eukprot:OHS97766.1 hypothetical protein TRFO_35941 [Tritrichomonas foetus]
MNENQLAFTTEDPMVYFQKFLTSYIQNDCRLIYLHTPVTKAIQIESASVLHCIFDATTSTVKIKPMNMEIVSYPISSFDKIEWQELLSSKKPLKIIHITVKDDKNPVNLAVGGQGKQELLDFWYDGLRLHLGFEPSTESSQKKIKIFQDAVSYATMAENIKEPEIPPPPSSLNFAASPSMPVIMAKK